VEVKDAIEAGVLEALAELTLETVEDDGPEPGE
jgi:hypothetical protein